MSIRARSNVYIPWTSLVFALLGLAWCGYILFPSSNSAPCATSGCALFRDSLIAGVSLWWAGGLYFFLLAIACLRGNRELARFMALVALFLDTVLLVVMLFTAPCFDCLVTAAFLGLTYSCLCYGGDGWFVSRRTPSVLLPIWFGFFLSNALLAANEQIPLYSMGNSRSTDVRIYFSPSCEACRSAILMSGNAAALYPVEEKNGDMDSIIRLQALLRGNVPLREALARSITPEEPVPHLPFHERLFLAVQLMRNKAAVLRQGFRALPLIQINGMPADKTAPMEGIRERPPHTKDENGHSLKEPVHSPAVSRGEEHGASGGGKPQQGPAPESTDGQSQPEIVRRSSPDERGQSVPESLPDFLLQNSDELSRCSRTSGAPCNEPAINK
ncbi:MAG: hypothetical protein LBD42_03320 [Desulfovibrio sp.]|nr:hypothetical protein [Desulfovibrio sp.]